MTATIFYWLTRNALFYWTIVASALGIGMILTRSVRFHSPLEKIVFSLCAGFAFWSLFLLCLATFRILLRPAVIAATLLSAALLPYGVWAQLHRLRLDPTIASQKAKKRRKNEVLTELRARRRKRLLFFALSAFLAVTWSLLFLQTQYPPTQWDATSNHLVFVREQIRNHGLAAPEGIPNPIPPALNHYLFVWGMMLGGETLTQAVEQIFMLLTALAMISWGLRTRRLAMGIGAAAFWVAHPLVRALSVAAYIDVGLATAVLLGVYALRVFLEEQDPHYWYLGMSILGMAAGTKTFGLFFCALGTAVGVYSFAHRRLTARSLLFGLSLGALVCFPWYGFVAWVTGGNPLWPLMPQLASGIWAQKNPIVHSMVGLPRTFSNFLLFPIKLITDPVKFSPDFSTGLNSVIAFWPLAWIVSIRDRGTRWWTVWALLYSVVWFASAQFVRYWLVAVPLVCLGMAEAIEWLWAKLPQLRRARTVFWVVAAAAFMLFPIRDYVWRWQLMGWPPTNKEQRSIYADSFVSGHGGARYVNEHAVSDEAVYTLNAGFLNYWIEHPVVDFFSILSGERAPTFRWPEDARWLQRLKDAGVRWILVRHVEAAWLAIPRQDLVDKPFWPGFRLVYADDHCWVFREVAGP